LSKLLNTSAREWMFAPLTAVLMAASPGVDADDHGPDQADDLLETVIVTAMRSEEDVLEVTEAVSVVGAAAVDRKAPDVLAQMLHGLPGTYFQ
jgi:outer membrane cobalamin receptor